MGQANNPAGELLQLMKKILEQADDLPMAQVWAVCFGCKSTNSGEIVQGIMRAIELTEEGRQATKSFVQGDPSIYLAPFDNIEQFLHNHGFNGKVSSYRPFLNAATITALSFVDHMLSQEYSSEHPGAMKNVREFIQALDELLEECLSSDISSGLKELFTHHLETLRQALYEYRLGGEAKLHAAMDQFTGSMIRNRESIGAEFNKVEDIMGKSVGIMTKIEELVIKTKAVATLAAPAATNLLSWFK
ncbi:hypothetical protein [Pseudomonas putida]|uniref:hypothetical protein n=1 Tax=Pseudomonas putida TaxID=303 RepID=UPI000DFB78B2|nr:hypothetical protein [Pseudomonas putida]SUD80245.1 Uncharacterised protein [Pseudomonas putida]